MAQVGGDHYDNMEIQPIDYIQSNGLSFEEGNIIKYITRWRTKGGIIDLEKAAQYLLFLRQHASENPERYGLDENLLPLRRD